MEIVLGYTSSKPKQYRTVLGYKGNILMHKSLVNQSPLLSAITFERSEIRQHAYT